MKKPTVVPALLLKASTAKYTGEELRPFEGRPGAMDAFALPSLQAGKRVERKKPGLIMSSKVPQVGKF